MNHPSTLRRYAAVLALLLGCSAAAARSAPPAERALAGRYALELRVASTSRVMVVGTTHSMATSLLLVELRPGPDGWLQSHRVCDARVESGSPLARLVIPPAFVDAIPARLYTARLESGVGSRYTADMGVEAIGFDPRLTGGVLPTSPNARGVEDPDGDGEPGATLRLRMRGLGSARLFVVQRSHLVLDGRRTGPGRFEGEVDVRLQEQHTLGADPGFFRQNPSNTPDPERSGFTLVRVPAETGCEELRAATATLFP